MNNIIICGRKCVGKSTYLKEKYPSYVDFDKFIWSQCSTTVRDNMKAEMREVIRTNNLVVYRDILRLISDHVLWNAVIEEANKISTVFEMPALGMWWDLIPHGLRYNSFIFKVDCADDVRLARLKKRGCLEDIDSFDLFYKDPPIIHCKIMV